ncbi:hypothetical protein GCM10027047_12370 [Rhodococcus aerolatus]
MPGRFQVYTSAAAAGPVRWRLISENGRPLAQSAIDFPTYELARDDAAAVREWLPTARFVLSVQDRAGWGWEVHDGPGERGVARARSTRRYSRRVECLRAVSRFSSLGLESSVGPRVLSFPLRSPDLGPHPT